MADTLYGVDVSKWQGTIDWPKVKDSGKVDFVITKIGSGRLSSQKDKTFETNYTSAKRIGIPIGGYWYSYAMSADEAVKEANACLECIKGKQFEYPIYFDIEEEKQLRLGRSAVSKMIKAFCDTLEAAGYFVGVYTSKSHFDSYVDNECRTKYTSWVAHYGVAKTTYTGPYDMWQKSDKGKIDGISGNVDLDECYRDFPSIIKKLGKNGFTKTEETTTAESIKPETLKPAPTESLTKVEIICHSLNVRTGPSLSSKAVDIARNGEVYVLDKEQNGWGRIKEKNLWISIKPHYVKKI